MMKLSLSLMFKCSARKRVLSLKDGCATRLETASLSRPKQLQTEKLDVSVSCKCEIKPRASAAERSWTDDVTASELTLVVYFLG
jgi:hypothetical protein